MTEEIFSKEGLDELNDALRELTAIGQMGASSDDDEGMSQCICPLEVQGNPLIRTPLRPFRVSCLVKCPDFRG